MNFDCVIFDMDGTLTEPWLDFDAIRADLGLPAGEPILETIERMPAERRDQFHRRLVDHEMAAARQAPLTPGAHEIVRRIRAAGLALGILTRNTRPALEMVVERLGLKFDLKLSREDGPVKPDPATLLDACRQLGVETHRTACVGDYLYDLQAANAAGCVSILLARGREWPWADQADYVIHTLGELAGILGI